MRYGILLDKSLIIENCLSNNPDNNDFINFLRSNPEKGIITHKIRSSIKYNISNNRKFSSSREKMITNFRNLETFVKLENVDFNSFKKNMSEVNYFFNNLSNKSKMFNPSYVSKPFRGLVAHIQNSYPEKIFCKNIETEDKEILSEAICLSERYRPMFLASYDKHFSERFISGKIKTKFGIECGYPHDILSRAKECQTYI